MSVDEHKVIALPNALTQCFYTLPSSLKTNMRNFVDMEIKSRYLIWRQKNQMFYAIDVENMLFVWSMISGKLLYHRKLEAADQIERASEFETYDLMDRDGTSTNLLS